MNDSHFVGKDNQRDNTRGMVRDHGDPFRVSICSPHFWRFALLVDVFCVSGFVLVGASNWELPLEPDFGYRVANGGRHTVSAIRLR